MKIKNVLIRNYKSLKEVELTNLDSMVVLIGKNSSGKSNVLEAINLFFHEYDAELFREIPTPDDHIWFKRNQKNPIDIIITIEFSDLERRKIIPKESLERMKLQGDNKFSIHRQIIVEQKKAFWRTIEIKMGQAYLVKENENVIERKGKSIEVNEQLTENITKIVTTTNKNILKLIKGKLELIPGTRDNVIPNPILTNRTSIIPNETQTRLINLKDSRTPSDELKWDKIEQYIKDMDTPLNNLDVGNSILVRIGGLRFQYQILVGAIKSY